MKHHSYAMAALAMSYCLAAFLSSSCTSGGKADEAAEAPPPAQDSRDISEYAYKKGAASLLDFLDAERSYRSTQLAYRQAVANYMFTVEQLKSSVGTRTLSR